MEISDEIKHGDVTLFWLFSLALDLEPTAAFSPRNATIYGDPLDQEQVPVNHLYCTIFAAN
jgi:hypothetical protein